MGDPDPEKTNWVVVGIVIVLFIAMIAGVAIFLASNPQGILAE